MSLSQSKEKDTTKTEFFDDEARKIFQQLNVNGKEKRAIYNSLDPIWSHNRTKGIIYVGNQVAAEKLNILNDHKITYVVNCTDNIVNYHENNSSANIKYYRFDVAYWMQRTACRPDRVIEFVQPLFNFIDSALLEGNNVLIHCLAGAHRAGTTGVVVLMYYAELDMNLAVRVAKLSRPIINPIGTLPMFLECIEQVKPKLARNRDLFSEDKIINNSSTNHEQVEEEEEDED